MSDISLYTGTDEWYAEVPRKVTKHFVIGLTLLVVTFGGFGAWAFTAPLAAAVIAQGSFVATGRNKIVQHFEGGIIRDILISEGDTVEEGQPLLVLDETAALATERELFLRQIRLEAMEARLLAEYRELESSNSAPRSKGCGPISTWPQCWTRKRSLSMHPGASLKMTWPCWNAGSMPSRCGPRAMILS